MIQIKEPLAKFPQKTRVIQILKKLWLKDPKQYSTCPLFHLNSPWTCYFCQTKYKKNGISHAMNEILSTQFIIQLLSKIQKKHKKQD